MKIFLTDQRKKFPEYLRQLCTVPVMKYNLNELKESESVTEINTLKKFEDIDLHVLFQYRIFPGNIMSSLTQWDHEDRKIKSGDTILQQVYIPPLMNFSQKIIFGVRIKEIIDEPHRKGYSYETLHGHVEQGISIFTVEKKENDRIVFSIKTFSKPATIVTKILGPILSVPYQAYCTKCALINVKRLTELTSL